MGQYRRSLFDLVFILLLMAAGLSACMMQGDDEQYRADDIGKENIVVTDTIGTETMDVSTHFDVFRGLAQTENDIIVLAGIKNRDPKIILTDTRLNTKSVFAPTLPTENAGELIGLCENRGGGFTLYYLNALGIYDDDGHLSGFIDLGEQTEGMYGPVQLNDERYLFWWDDTAYICDQNGLSEQRVFIDGAQIVSVCSAQGSIYVYLNHGGILKLFLMDETTLDIAEYAVFSETAPIGITRYGGNYHSLCVNDGYGVYTYLEGENRFEKRFDWAQASINGHDVGYLLFLEDDGVFLCIDRDTLNVYRISKTGQSERERITVGMMGDYMYGLPEFIARFNATNKSYYAEIVYYDEYNQDALLVDLGTGNAPDVICMDNAYRIPLRDDIFTDLLPYLENDGQISRSDFYPHVFDLMLIDGKMLSAISSFNWFTFSVRAADIGDRNTWTIDDAMTMLEEHPDRYLFAGWNTADNMLGWASTCTVPQFVDLDTMTCDFENENFYMILEFCKSAQGRIAPRGVYDYDPQILLTFESFQNVIRIGAIKNNYRGEAYRFIGFPNHSGNSGNYLAKGMWDLSFSVPLGTENKEAAWSFIRGIYSDAWQAETRCFPIIESALQTRLEEQIKDPGFQTTQEDVDYVMDTIERIDMFHYPDLNISDIIREESMYYISGDKTAEEVASVIQSRVSLLLSERQ